MIVRTWRAVAASTADAAAYAEHLDTSVFPQLREIDGHVGAYLMQRQSDERIAVQVITVWESMRAIREFAGDAPEIASSSPRHSASLRASTTG